MKYLNYFLIALLLTNSTLSLAAGNTKLMQQKKNRVFLLNEELLSTLGGLEKDSNISFSGKVIRGSDGKLQIKIDQIDGISPYSAPSSMTQRTKIKYISFEEMLGKPAPETTTSQKQPPATHNQSNPAKTNAGLYGGGSVH